MIITVLSFKGGVGKSTIAQNLTVYFAHQGQTVALVDADVNASSIQWYGVRDKELAGCTVVGNQDPRSITKMVQDLAGNYDHIIIDCPPLRAAVTNRALIQADVCVIPLTSSGGSDIWTTEQLFQHIEATRLDTGQPIPVVTILNRYEGHKKLHQELKEILPDYQGEYKFDLPDFEIGDRVMFGTANSEGLGVMEKSNPKAKEEIERLGRYIQENYG
jgi:chromosome partitioning protein